MVIAISTLVVPALGICLWLLVSSLRLPATSLPITTEWLESLSAERYRPMLRLLDQGDLEFVSKQPGITPQMAAEFRAQRCRLLRAYLRSMQADFGRICAALKVVMAQSKHDRSDLATALVQSQITFTYRVFMVQLHLQAYRWGFGRVDVSSLVKLFDGMRLELRTLVPAGSIG
jgi:hypothetical protein